MDLDTENLARFKGGQLEVMNPSEGYVYRGEIESVEVANENVRVKFAWVARGKGGYPPNGWINHDDLLYAASTAIYVATDIGDGRVAMSSAIVGETAVFFPPDGSKLDPAKVEGLKLAA